MNKKTLGLLTAFALMSGNNSIKLEKNDLRIKNKNLNKKPIPKGCKIYQFGSFECVAINYKTAQRKFNKYMLNKMKL